MSILLDSETDDYDLATGAIVLSHVMAAAGDVRLNLWAGTEAKPCVATAGVWELRVFVKRSGMVNYHRMEPYPQDMLASNELRKLFVSKVFDLNAGDHILVNLKSPNAGDSDVGVYAELIHVTGALPAVAPNAVGGLPVLDANSLVNVDVERLGGVVQSLTDLKDFADTGYDPSTHTVGSYLKGIMATALTETSGYLAAAFKKFFNVETPVATAETVNQTGDCFPNIALSVALEVMRSGLSFFGIVTAIDGANHKFTIAEHTALPQGTFIDGTAPYRAFVMFDAGGAGAAPQGETQNVTGFVAATGEYTTDAFTTPVGIGDYVIIMHPRIAELADVRADVTAILADTGTDGVVLADGAITAAKLAADAITAAKVAADVHAEAADAVWDEALAGHSTAGTAGKALSDVLTDSEADEGITIETNHFTAD